MNQRKCCESKFTSFAGGFLIARDCSSYFERAWLPLGLWSEQDIFPRPSAELLGAAHFWRPLKCKNLLVYLLSMKMPCAYQIDPNFSLGFPLIYYIKLNLSLFSELSLIPCSVKKACSSPAVALSWYYVVKLPLAHCQSCVSVSTQGGLIVKLLWLPLILQCLYFSAYPWIVLSPLGLGISDYVSLCSLCSCSKIKAQIYLRKEVRRMAAMPGGQASAQSDERFHGKGQLSGETWRCSRGGLRLVWAPWQPSPCVSVKYCSFLAVLMWKWILNY